MTLVLGLDTETTGVDVEKDRVVEIALIVMELETGIERLRFERRINPGIHIPPKVVAVHGITDADVATCQPFNAIAQGFATIFERADVVVGHNIEGFDIPLLINELVRAKVELKGFPAVIDTMLHSRWATDDGKVPNLGELCFALDTPYDPSLAHGATYDVMVNLQAFRRGWQLGYYTIPTLTRSMAA